MKWIGILLLAVAQTSVVMADKLPERTIPAGVGVNIHFTTGHERELKMIAAAGFKFVRMDFLWDSTERQKGQYDWSDYDAFTSELERHGLRPYYIFDYSNPLYEENVTGANPITHQPETSLASPQHPESIAAYARWAAAAAEHFRGRGVIWEIWNEPNISFWKPRPDAAQYSALALATARAVRAADPQACIVGPTTSGFDWKFLETVFKSGLLEYLNAVSVHPYRGGKPPETAASDFTRLRDLIARYAPPGRNIPIVSGEWGYSSCTKGVSPEKQANYIVRQQLSNLFNGVPLSIWYDWKNDGQDPAYGEDNFGTVGYNLTPKPAYLAIQTMTRALFGYSIAQRYDTGNTNDFVLVLTNAAGHSTLAAWTLKKPHSVEFNSRLNLNLTAMPQYAPVE
ncbi:MAG TPA: cellulase family glycosylhydrolase [Candidatus Sulfotelmatobacter sp.]|nr:cellulase family glycosylhydrolase [Candidatus Sulfotelmatobacter sp.]